MFIDQTFPEQNFSFGQMFCFLLCALCSFSGKGRQTTADFSNSNSTTSERLHPRHLGLGRPPRLRDPQRPRPRPRTAAGTRPLALVECPGSAGADKGPLGSAASSKVRDSSATLNSRPGDTTGRRVIPFPAGVFTPGAPVPPGGHPALHRAPFTAAPPTPILSRVSIIASESVLLWLAPIPLRWNECPPSGGDDRSRPPPPPGGHAKHTRRGVDPAAAAEAPAEARGPKDSRAD